MWGWELLAFASSAALTTACAAFVWQRAPHFAARAFALLLLGETLWSLGYLGELASVGLSQKLFWDNVQFVAWVAIVPLTLLFAWAYAQRGPRNVGAFLGWFMLVPLGAAAWVFTDPWHGMARANAHVVPAPPFGSLHYDFTLPELLFIAQTYATTLYAVALLLRTAYQDQLGLRVQALLVVFGLMLPMALALPGLLGYPLWSQRDVAPACFGLAALPITYALYRGRFLDLVPVARHRVFQRLSDPVLVIDPNQRLVDANPSAQLLFFGTRDVIGQSLEAVLPAAAELLKVEFGSRAEAPASTVQGRTQAELALHGRTFEVSVESMSEDPALKQGFVLLFRDVTARKGAEQELVRMTEELELRVRERTRELHERIAEKERAEQAARASEQRFRSLVDGSSQFMSTLSREGIVLMPNRTSLELAGAEAADVVGKPFWEGPWWSHSAELRARVQEAVRNTARGTVTRIEVSQPDRQGRLRTFDFVLKPLTTDDSGELILLAEGHDMSERQRAEQERALLREQLHHSQKLESVGRLAGGIAHDFNNLLTVILGHIELARMDMRRGRHRIEALEQASAAGDSAATLTRQLLMFARKQPSNPKVLRLNDVVDHTQRMLRRVIGEDIELVVEVEPGLHPVFAEAGQLEQLLLNLAVNARDAMERGGILTIETRNVVREADERGTAQREYVKLSVRDTGSGMSPETLQHIFEPFFTTKSAGKGTGIGLATVDNIIRQAGGHIEVISSLGHGSTFDVYLPASSGEIGSVKPSVVEEIPKGREHIALVEDQPALRALAEEQLRELGYRLTSFSSAEEALRELSPSLQGVDLLVTDIVLEGESGGVLVERLRALRPDLPVLYMSGYADEWVMLRGVDARTAPFLHKPFSLNDLAHAVRRVMTTAA